MIYGYARVSSFGQASDGNSLEAQEMSLRSAGAVEIFKDAFTGTKSHRPELDKLLSVLEDGDTLIATKLDRIARSMIHGYELIDGLLQRGVKVYILNLGVMDNTPASKLTRNIFLAFAEYERDMIFERTQEGKGIKKANDPNYKEGRKPVEYDVELFKRLLQDVHSGALSVIDAAERLGVSRAKWYRIVKERQSSLPSTKSTSYSADQQLTRSVDTEIVSHSFEKRKEEE